MPETGVRTTLINAANAAAAPVAVALGAAIVMLAGEAIALPVPLLDALAVPVGATKDTAARVPEACPFPVAVAVGDTSVTLAGVVVA